LAPHKPKFRHFQRKVLGFLWELSDTILRHQKADFFPNFAKHTLHSLDSQGTNSHLNFWAQSVGFTMGNAKSPYGRTMGKNVLKVRAKRTGMACPPQKHLDGKFSSAGYWVCYRDCWTPLWKAHKPFVFNFRQSFAKIEGSKYATNN
jgi:hypothetical protein